MGCVNMPNKILMHNDVPEKCLASIILEQRCFPNIHKMGFRNAEVMQVPENREDSCHLANCTNFVSDYFFPCGSCTYFQWNKRESQAHAYLQGHHFKVH